MRIGDAAAAAGTTPRALRFYEENGLLPPPRRTAAGQRVYGPQDVRRLRMIRQLLELRLTVADVRLAADRLDLLDSDQLPRQGGRIVPRSARSWPPDPGQGQPVLSRRRHHQGRRLISWPRRTRPAPPPGPGPGPPRRPAAGRWSVSSLPRPDRHRRHVAACHGVSVGLLDLTPGLRVGDQLRLPAVPLIEDRVAQRAGGVGQRPARPAGDIEDAAALGVLTSPVDDRLLGHRIDHRLGCGLEPCADDRPAGPQHERQLRCPGPRSGQRPGPPPPGPLPWW